MSLFPSPTTRSQHRNHSRTPHSLLDLEGIGTRLAYRITTHYQTLFREWKRYDEHDHIFKHLKTPDELPTDDATILKCIEHDPYELQKIRGISFKRADQIALNNFNIDPDHKTRHAAGNQGILTYTGTMPRWKFQKERDKLGLRNPEHELAGVKIDHGNVWLPAELAAEQRLAHLFEDTLTNPKPPTLVNLENVDLGGKLNADQLKAVETALSGTRIMLLTGGAGTGKTFTTAAIAKAARANKKHVRIMAFAGKAAMRSQEAMHEDNVDWVPCSTIHRALGLNGPHAHGNPVDEAIIILDEASMIPNWLMAAVTRNMPAHATLILVGDPNQLPPIGHGTPFQDALKLGLPHVHLEQNYRQAGQITIHQFAEAIRTQNPNAYEPPTPETGVFTRFELDPTTAEHDFNNTILTASNKLTLHDWQLVTWKNDTRHALNQHVQDLLNPTGKLILTYPLWGMKDEYGRTLDAEVRVGDKILITDNDYTHNVFNGQTGVIIDTGPNRELLIDFDIDEPKLIPFEDAADLLQLGYAVTVHKAQGSGWDTVVLYQPEPVRFSPRRFYYTSVTRAKNNVHVFTTLPERNFWMNILEPDRDPESTLINRVNEAR